MALVVRSRSEMAVAMRRALRCAWLCVALCVAFGPVVANAQDAPRRVEIPRDRHGMPGETVTVPVLLDAAEGVEAIDIEIAFDAAVLGLASGSPRLGELLAGAGAVPVFNVDEAAGTIRGAIAVPATLGPASGSLLLLDLTIAANAPPGASPLNLVSVSLNEDGLPLDPTPTESADDDVDGELTVTGDGALRFVRGDTNGDLTVDISDAVATLNRLFKDGVEFPCAAAANANAADGVDISDAIYTLQFLFTGGPPPPAPFRDCGVSTVEDDLALGCEASCAAGG